MNESYAGRKMQKDQSCKEKECKGNPPVVQIKNLIKNYGSKGFQSRVLKGIDLTILKNDFIAIMGPSGSGKTTLLNILSTISIHS